MSSKQGAKLTAVTSFQHPERPGRSDDQDQVVHDVAAMAILMSVVFDAFLWFPVLYLAALAQHGFNPSGVSMEGWVVVASVAAITQLTVGVLSGLLRQKGSRFLSRGTSRHAIEPLPPSGTITVATAATVSQPAASTQIQVPSDESCS